MNKFTLNHKKLQLVLKSVVLNWARSLRCLHEFIKKQFENRHINTQRYIFSSRNCRHTDQYRVIFFAKRMLLDIVVSF